MAAANGAQTNAVPTILDNKEILRYGRQMILNGIGLPGQERLKKSKVCYSFVGAVIIDTCHVC